MKIDFNSVHPVCPYPKRVYFIRTTAENKTILFILKMNKKNKMATYNGDTHSKCKWSHFAKCAMLKMYEMRVFCVCGCIAVLFRSVRSRTLLCEWIGIFADVSERVENMFKWRLFGKIVLFYACLLCCFSFILSCLWLDPK